MRAVPSTFRDVAEYGSIFQALMADNIRCSIGKDLQLVLRRGPLIAAATATIQDHPHGSDAGDIDDGDGDSTDDYYGVGSDDSSNSAGDDGGGGGGNGSGSDGQSTVENYDEAAEQAPASPRSTAASSTPSQMSDLVFYTDLDDSDDDDSDGFTPSSDNEAASAAAAPSSDDEAPPDLVTSDDDDSDDGSAPPSDDEAASTDSDGGGSDAGGEDDNQPPQQLARHTAPLRDLYLSIASGSGPRLHRSVLPRRGDLLLLTSKPALKPSDLDRSSGMFSALALAGEGWDSSGGLVTVAASWDHGCLYGALARDMHGGERLRSICVTKIGSTISDERQYTSFDELLQRYNRYSEGRLPGIAKQLLWGLSVAAPTPAVEHLLPAAVLESAQALFVQRRLNDSQRQAVLQLLALAFRSANDRIARAALETDEERTRAVREALQRQLIRAIHGPPGTGKSTTIVVLLELLLGLDCRALVVAPSNMAVQEVAAKLLPYLTSDGNGDGGAAAAPVGIGPRRRGDVVLFCSKMTVCPEGLQPLWLDFRVQRIAQAQQEWAGGIGDLKAMLHPAAAPAVYEEAEALVDRLQAVEVVMRSAKERLEGELPRRFLDSTASLGMPALLRLLSTLRHAAAALATQLGAGPGQDDDPIVAAFHTARSSLLAAVGQCGVCRASQRAWPAACIQHAGILLCTDSFCARTDVRVGGVGEARGQCRGIRGPEIAL